MIRRLKFNKKEVLEKPQQKQGILTLGKLNKKGAAMGMKETVMAFIALIVLIVVVWALYSFFSGKGLPFFKGLPEFNQTKPIAVSAEILGYSFSEDKVKYYDGNEWVDFEGKEIELNEKKIAYQTAFDNFKNAWRRLLPIQYGSFTFSSYESAKFLFNRFLIGDIYILHERDENNWDYCVLGLDEKFQCSKEGMKEDTTALENDMKKFALEQRTELLKKPAQFNYYDTKEKASKSIYACMKISAVAGKYYLVVDLSKPVKQTDICNV